MERIDETVKLPIEQTEKQKINTFRLRTPMNITCRQFINELIHTTNAAVDVAEIAESLSFLNIGIKNTPPPNPKPLKIPAKKLAMKMSLIF